jgi:hypothetical protein
MRPPEQTSAHWPPSGCAPSTALWLCLCGQFPGLQPLRCSPPSFSAQVGIFYDKEVQAEAAALVSDWSLADMEYMREQVGRI